LSKDRRDPAPNGGLAVKKPFYTLGGKCRAKERYAGGGDGRKKKNSFLEKGTVKLVRKGHKYKSQPDPVLPHTHRSGTHAQKTSSGAPDWSGSGSPARTNTKKAGRQGRSMVLAKGGGGGWGIETTCCGEVHALPRLTSSKYYRKGRGGMKQLYFRRQKKYPSRRRYPGRC